MRIWSIQSREAWEYLERHGELMAKRHHCSDSWPQAYDWMKAQLTRRIGPPPLENTEPLWGWYQWNNERQKRPDLRSVRHNWSPPGPYVMLECELPVHEVLLSDFGAWHFPLNDWHLALQEQEDERFSQALDHAYHRKDRAKLEILQREKEKSWEVIFDLQALDHEDWKLIPEKEIQACFWQIKVDKVKSVTKFTSRQSKTWT
ncbi:DUF3841 domain-containing protein [Emcibacter sp.]|uniref:DUF3841 domain-containing protein n=1 Tax=Emcibacter sp. TaxID=1979954 RepID=UPI002AA63B14|nr:DUF3841 domain-containing protein [Emcibacter sp.]